MLIVRRPRALLHVNRDSHSCRSRWFARGFAGTIRSSRRMGGACFPERRREQRSCSTGQSPFKSQGREDYVLHDEEVRAGSPTGEDPNGGSVHRLMRDPGMPSIAVGGDAAGRRGEPCPRRRLRARDARPAEISLPMIPTTTAQDSGGSTSATSGGVTAAVSAPVPVTSGSTGQSGSVATSTSQDSGTTTTSTSSGDGTVAVLSPVATSTVSSSQSGSSAISSPVAVTAPTGTTTASAVPVSSGGRALFTSQGGAGATLTSSVAGGRVDPCPAGGRRSRAWVRSRSRLRAWSRP